VAVILARSMEMKIVSRVLRWQSSYGLANSLAKSKG
jgi:hypothetical protein